MTKSKFSIVALSALLAFGTFSTISADSGHENAESDVEFSLDKGTVVDPGLPVDPEFPTDPTDPNPGADTDFRIWYVPSAFVFEKGSLSAVAESYQMVGNRETAVAVADLRDSRAGWNLGATLSDLVNETTQTPIVGATISWNQVVLEVVDPKSGATDISDVDGSGNVTIDKELSSVMKADAGNGFGYHAATMNEVKLNVPGKQGESGAYTGTVNWTLSNTPQISE